MPRVNAAANHTARSDRRLSNYLFANYNYNYNLQLQFARRCQTHGSYVVLYLNFKKWKTRPLKNKINDLKGA